jgi:hypothetical protein
MPRVVFAVIEKLEGRAHHQQTGECDEKEECDAGRRLEAAEGKNAGSDGREKQDQRSEEKGHCWLSYLSA